MASLHHGHTVTLENISIGYRKGVPLLEGVNLDAAAGEMIALVGCNGSGKSTLLRSVLGLIPLLGGSCRLEGIPVQDYDVGRRARTVSFVSSQAARPAVTVRELVSLGRIPYTGWTGKLGKRDHQLVEATIREVGMEHHMDRSLEQLSDGERQRVMIARAFVQDTPVMLLDEPAAYLDIPHKYDLVRLLSVFRDQGKTIIYSTHDLETALMAADKFWIIHQGQVHEGSPEDLGIKGLFDKLFEDAGIGFDPGSGRFKYRKEQRGTVRLTGEPGTGVTWTRYALERLGFGIAEGESAISVEVVISGEDTSWTLIRKEGEESFSSLYSMARSLTRDD